MYVVEWLGVTGGVRKYRAYREMEHWYLELMDRTGEPGMRMLRIVFDSTRKGLAMRVIRELLDMVMGTRGVINPDDVNRVLARLYEAEYGDAMIVNVLSEFKDVTSDGVFGNLHYIALLG